MANDIGRQTFDRLLLEHLPALQRFTIRLCGNVTQAEDIAQEAVVRAARAWNTYRAQASFKTWLFQIAINVFRDSLARRATRQRLPGDLIDQTTPDPATSAQETELGVLIARLISTLPPRQREVLVLLVHEQLEYADAARVLGISEQNLRATLHLARQRMKQLLEPYLNASRRHE
jgi:RNA polymerase sigma-70 factor, ECF subfamily